ncbi:olfactory receptor 52D1-like [Solea senegalensis]|uniref:Olfactory receptor 52D1-like n=1 Tax=Solea senegalensis TaxID=28829 RepID=A0AAV6SJJ3_SOLSE|nr:olfactory receptor 52D1-like [Solea senegalensis]
MDNTTALTFTMTAYAVMENYKYWMFALFLLIYLVILVLNVLLMVVTHRHKELHQPMNILSCILSISEIYGATALYPSILALLLSKTHELSVKWCMAQVFFLHTYCSTEFSVLAAMGYDRYVAICKPLHYHSIMSNSKAGKLGALAVIYSLIVFGCLYSITVQLRFCGKKLPKLYCVNMELVKNACSPVSYISTVGLVFILLLIVPQLAMVVFSYVQISRVCRKLSRESQHNALKTCVPHLLSLANFTIASLFEIAQTRFDMSHVATEAQIFLSLYFVILVPITNPVLYGFGTQMVRVHMLKMFITYKTLSKQFTKTVTEAVR